MADGVNVNDGTGSKILTDEVTTVDGVTVSARHAQQLKVGHGADGAFEGIRAASPLEVRLYGAGGAAVSIDGDRLQVKAISDQLPSSLGVGGALPVITEDINASIGLWNGTGADGARTTSFASANQTNAKARGLVVALNMTAVPGTDTIAIRIGSRSAYNLGYQLWQSAAFSATGQRLFMLYPGLDITYAQQTVAEVESLVLPLTFTISVIHSGAGSFTYDLSYTLIR